MERQQRTEPTEPTGVQTTPPPLSSYARRRVDGRAMLTWNVKVHWGPTAEECADVLEENGLTAEDKAPPYRGAAPMPFGPGWIDAFWTGLTGNGSAEGHEPYQWAQEQAFERAEEDARELFGEGAKVYAEGRSGGWLVLELPPYELETHEEYEARQAGEDSPDLTAAEAAEHAAFLERLATFDRCVREELEDFPRSVAWHYAVNAFEPALRAHRKTATRDAAAERLERAVTALRDAAERCGSLDAFDEPGPRLSACYMASVEYDAARAYLAALDSDEGGAS